MIIIAIITSVFLLISGVCIITYRNMKKSLNKKSSWRTYNSKSSWKTHNLESSLNVSIRVDGK